MAFNPSNPSGPAGRPFRSAPPVDRERQRNFDEHRVNERIRVPQVRLIDEKGNQVGVVDTREALRMARDRGLDLMEMAANANPPVCKITDYGKFKYEKKKKDHEAKKKQVVVKVKEVQFRPTTDQHDIDYKFRNICGFLEEGDKAKITILFRGREMAHTDPGYKLLNDLTERLKDKAIIESPPKMEGRKLMMILAPLAPGKKPSAAPSKGSEAKKSSE